MRRVIGIALTASLVAASASAQPRDVQQADVLFREGRAAMKSGDLDVACPKLEKSYQFDPAAGTAVNLGDCFEKQGKVASALLAYQAARKLLRPGDPRIAPVEKQIAALEQRAPKLTITLAPNAPEGTVVTRDGRAVDFADLAQAIAVNPGEVVITVGAPGHRTRKFKTELAEGMRREIEVNAGVAIASIEREDSAPTAGTAHDSHRSAGQEQTSGGSTQRPIGYVAGALGLGLVIVGTVNAVDWNSKNAELNATNTGAEYDKLRPERDGARTRTLWGFGLGAAALATSTVLIFTSPSGDRPVAHVRFGPSVSGSGAVGEIGGTW